MILIFLIKLLLPKQHIKINENVRIPCLTLHHLRCRSAALNDYFSQVNGNYLFVHSNWQRIIVKSWSCMRLVNRIALWNQYYQSYKNSKLRYNVEHMFLCITLISNQHHTNEIHRILNFQKQIVLSKRLSKRNPNPSPTSSTRICQRSDIIWASFQLRKRHNKHIQNNFVL